MSDIKPTVPEAIDLLASIVEGQMYHVRPSVRQAMSVVLDELTRVQAELNRAAGEIVRLREEVNEHIVKLSEAAGFSKSLIHNLEGKVWALEKEISNLREQANDDPYNRVFGV